MPKEQFSEIIQTFKAQYIPKGSIELLEDEEIEANPFLTDLIHLPRITTLQAEKGKDNFFFSKIAERLVLCVRAEKTLYNIGILKYVAKRICDEIRNSAIRPTN
ncbi:MAG: hypothetical protein JXR03_07080 [Cyclobacteriaceae bacterium]